MGDMEEVAERLGLPLSADQQRAGRYLERQGLRFCVDFGIDNALALEREHTNKRRRDLYAIRSARAATAKKRQRKVAAERFWRQVSKSADCWIWTGSLKAAGYGQFRLDVHALGNVSAHRYSWELAHGTIPDALHVLHRCDNPACVRPDHLFLGTHQDNMVDRTQKHRMPHGETHSKAKLSTEQVVAIWRRIQAGDPYRRIAIAFNIDRSTVSNIATRKTWQLETASL